MLSCFANCMARSKISPKDSFFRLMAADSVLYTAATFYG